MDKRIKTAILIWAGITVAVLTWGIATKWL
jgi:hypothetical protein